MHYSLISKRYAEALLELAIESKNLDLIKDDMGTIIKLCQTDREFRLFLRSPVIRPDMKIRVLNGIFEGKVEELTMKFIQLIARHRREPILEQIANQFISLYKKHNNIVTTYLTTAAEITDDIKEMIIKIMKDYTKGNIELHEDIDKDLLGGFILRFEDKQFDSSLRNRINQLKKEFEENLYIRGF
jgi:F-type H+-transporting ATPase subunit delta